MLANTEHIFTSLKEYMFSTDNIINMNCDLHIDQCTHQNDTLDYLCNSTHKMSRNLKPSNAHAYCVLRHEVTYYTYPETSPLQSFRKANEFATTYL